MDIVADSKEFCGVWMATRSNPKNYHIFKYLIFLKWDAA